MNEINNMTTPPGYQFKLIHEEVASEDLFDGEPHKKVADAMYNLITSQKRSITIGLEGEWGAGKSTVVKILSDKIKKEEKGYNPENTTLIYSFDAWAHEGDPLRRIFLEDLIDSVNQYYKYEKQEGYENDEYGKKISEWLSKDKEHNKKELDKKIAVIHGKIKTSTVNTQYHSTSFAKWLSIAGLLIPAGAAFLSQVKYENLTLRFGKPDFLFCSGIACILAPLIVAVIRILWYKFKLKKKCEFNLLNTTSNQECTKSITEDGERTSIEFENDFSDIIHAFIDKELVGRIIIIVDNIDRLETEDALKVWSTLQTFFQFRSRINKHEPWLDKVWFIVPYDKEGFDNIWTKGNSKKQKSIKKSFLNKCFQVKFEVPPPVMSGWYNYFSHEIYKSLTEWPETKKKDIIATYQNCNSTLKISPTPREMRNFINQVGIIGLAWGKKISAEAIALYCFLRNELGELTLRENLVKGEINFPDNILEEKEGEVIIELAGLLFGVDKKTGAELLLVDDIKKGLYNGESQFLLDKSDNKFLKTAFIIAWKSARKERLLPNVNDLRSQELLINNTIVISKLSQINNEVKKDIKILEDVWIQNTHDKWDVEKLNYIEVFDCIKPLFSDRIFRHLTKQVAEFISVTLNRCVDNNDNLIVKKINYDLLLRTYYLDQMFKISFKKNDRGDAGTDLSKWPAVSKALMNVFHNNKEQSESAFELALEFALSKSNHVSGPMEDIEFAIKKQYEGENGKKLSGSKCYTLPLLLSISFVRQNVLDFITSINVTKEFWIAESPKAYHNEAFKILKRNPQEGKEILRRIAKNKECFMANLMLNSYNLDSLLTTESITGIK